MPALMALCEQRCANLTGEVIEIGFRSGPMCRTTPRAFGRWPRSSPPNSAGSSRLGGFGDDSFDAALSTWTLCTIRDPAAALCQVWRVLRRSPDSDFRHATLHFPT